MRPLRVRDFIAAVTVAALTMTAPAIPAQPAPSAQDILLHAKDELRRVPQPPYVVYTLDRVDRDDGQLDLEDSYSLRVWCRTGDRVSLSRRMDGERASGPLEFVRAEFDEPVDPGPPTDLLFAGAPLAPVFEDTDPSLPVLMRLQVRGNLDYRPSLVEVASDTYHLRLLPLRDPAHNRVRDLWVDKQTFTLQRAIVDDHLYEGFDALPEIFDLRYSVSGGVRVISAIHGRSDGAIGASGAPLHQVEYRYRDFAFPASLPDWYFEPATYGKHRADAPLH